MSLGDLKWEATKIIGPPLRIFLEGDKIVGVSFDKESTKFVKEQIKHKGRIGKFKKIFSKLPEGRIKIKLV